MLTWVFVFSLISIVTGVDSLRDINAVNEKEEPNEVADTTFDLSPFGPHTRWPNKRWNIDKYIYLSGDGKVQNGLHLKTLISPLEAF